MSAVARQASTVDIGLAGNTDSLTVLHIAYRIRLRMFKVIRAIIKYVSLLPEILFRVGIFAKSSSPFSFISLTSLLKRDTKDILMFNRGRLIAGTYLNHIVSSFTLFPQDSQCFVRIPRSNNAIRDLAVNKRAVASRRTSLKAIKSP